MRNVTFNVNLSALRFMCKTNVQKDWAAVEKVLYCVFDLNAAGFIFLKLMKGYVQYWPKELHLWFFFKLCYR